MVSCGSSSEFQDDEDGIFALDEGGFARGTVTETEHEDEDEDKHKMMINNSSPSDDFQPEMMQQQNDSNGTSTNVITRICQVCSKGFKSGKALGGHMRVHFQANKDLIFNKKLSKQSRPIIKFKKLKRERSDFGKKKKHNLHNYYKSQSDPEHKEEVADQIYTCSECEKVFPSAKSLFGHMRCHPEREWRGIQPPNTLQPVKTSPFSSVSDAELQYSHNEDDDGDQVDSGVVLGDGVVQKGVDLVKSLGSWSVTAKRGRKKAALDVAEDDQGMRDAVFHLMSLANGDFCESKKLVNEEFEATNSNSLTYKNENEEMSKRVPPEHNKKKKKRHRMEDHPVKELRKEEDSKSVGRIELNDDMIHVGNNNVKDVQENDFFGGGKLEQDQHRKWEDINWTKEYPTRKDFWDDEEKNRILVKKSKKKRKKMRDLESVHENPSLKMANSSPEEKFRCTTCDKCFPSHQALGGHRSSHNKFRMVIHNALDDSTTLSAAADEEEEEENLDNFSPTPLVEESKGSDEGGSEAGAHLCKICNKDFLTGQALGGHKRGHWIGQPEVPATTTSQVTSAGTCEAISHTDHRRVMGFDLNEEPPMEDDAAAAACGGYASSSYNSVGYTFF